MALNEPGADHEVYALEQAIADLARRAETPEGREEIAAEGRRFLDAQRKLMDLAFLISLSWRSAA